MFDAVGALQSVLLADPVVSGIVGTRVRPWPANQTLELPCVLLTMVGTVNVPTMSGSTFDRARVQVDCLARTHQERRSLSDAVRDALMDYSGGQIDRVLFLSATERTDDRAGNYGMVMEFDVIGR